MSYMHVERMPNQVLILVVMEEGQRLWSAHCHRRKRSCLNPCCNGRGSKTNRRLIEVDEEGNRLNPCCNGRGSKT